MTDHDASLGEIVRERIMSIESVALIADDERDPMKVHRSSEMFSGYFNMTNTICGAGLLGLPYAFANTGTVMGVFFIILAAVFSWLGISMLTLCCAKTGFPSTVYSITRPIHKHAPTFCDFLLLFQLFGAAVAYLIVVGDLMPAACSQLGFGSFWQKRDMWVITGFLAAMPLSIPHNIDYLKWTSGACVVFLIYVTMVVLVYSLPGAASPCIDQNMDDDGPCEGHEFIGIGDKETQLSFVNCLKVLSVFIFGYCCQITTFPVLNEITNPTKKRMDQLSGYALGTACALYTVVAVCGYYTYGDMIKTDLLLNYPENGITSAARISLSLVVTFSYPLQINPGRRCGMTIMHNFFDHGNEPSLSTTRFRYFGFTLGFLIASLVISLVVTDLGVVIQLIGATGGCMIMFILPGYCYLFHFPESELGEVNSKVETETTNALFANEAVEKVYSDETGSDAGDSEATQGLLSADGSVQSLGQLKVQLLPSGHMINGKDSQGKKNSKDSRTPVAARPPCDAEMEADIRSLGLVLEMIVPKTTLKWRRLAQAQMWIGIILVPIMVTMIFVS